MFKKLKDYCDELTVEFHLIPSQRKIELEAISKYINAKQKEDLVCQLIVICTHNSRRSHLGQLWLSVGASYYNFRNIESYSGGTEATAFNPRAVEAIRKVGFQVASENESSTNPDYYISWENEMNPYHAFSTKYSESPNPTKDFGAIMVCTDADEKCPVVEGADFRIPLPYNDPKAFDNTPQESEKYLERCRQIGREMLYVFSVIPS